MQEIRLDVRGGKWGVQINVKEFPILCPNCRNYFTNLYKHTGSRYGQVGHVHCKCGAELSLVDSDNIIEYIKISSGHEQITLDFKNLFCLTKRDFDTLRDKYGYDIHKHYLNKKIYLEDLIAEIESKLNNKIIPFQPSFPASETLCKWLGLIKCTQQKHNSYARFKIDKFKKE